MWGVVRLVSPDGTVRDSVAHATENSVDPLVAAFDRRGELLWVRSLGGEETEYAYDVAVAPSGALCVGGMYHGATTIDGVSVPYGDLGDLFLAGLAPDGTGQWVLAGSGSAWDNLLALGADSAGNFLAGGSTDGMILGGAVSVVDPVDGSGAFLAKISSLGGIVWVRTLTGPGEAAISDVECETADAIYIAGEYTTGVAIGDITLTGGLGFIARLTSSGEAVWARSLDARCVSIVRTGETLYVVGSFGATISFVPGTEDDLVAAGDQDAFVARFSDGGEFVWARRFGAGGYEGVMHAAASPNGGVYVCGSFEAEMVIGATTLTSRGLSDLFAVELAPSGSFGSAISGGSADEDFIISLASHEEGAILAGHVAGDATFSGGIALEGQGNEDAFLLQP